MPPSNQAFHPGRLVVVKGGAAVMEYVATHPQVAVGFAQISKVMVLIAKGCRVKRVALARALTDDGARKIFADTGIA